MLAEPTGSCTEGDMRIKIFGLLVVLMITIGCGSGSEDDLQNTGNDSNSQLNHGSEQVRVIPQIVTKPTEAIAKHAPTITPTPHPLISNETPPPINYPMPDLTPAPVAPYNPLLPTGSVPESVSAVNNKYFNGSVTGNGAITLNENLIDVTTEDGDSIKVAYRLPVSLSKIPDRIFHGAIILSDLSTLASTQKSLSLSDESGLLLYEVFTSSEEPIVLDPNSYINITQNERGESVGSVSEPIAIDISTSTGTIKIVNDQTVSINTASGTFQVYLQNSHILSSSRESTDPFTGYRIHVWIVRTT